MQLLSRDLFDPAVALLVVRLAPSFGELGIGAGLSAMVPGLLLLIATPFFGPMSRAAEA